MSSRVNREPETSDTRTEQSGTQDQEKVSTDTQSPEAGSSSAEIVAIPIDRVPIYWPHVRQWILAAFDQFPGEGSEAEALRKLSEGTWLLWVAWDDEPIGALVTEIIVYSEFMALRIQALGGKRFLDWRDSGTAMLEKFCRHHGIKRLEFAGRKGWLRRLPGFEMNRIAMVRNVCQAEKAAEPQR